MSRSIIACRKCHRPLAVKHHSGRLKVEPAVVVVLMPPDRAELVCHCGENRVVELTRLAKRWT